MWGCGATSIELEYRVEKLQKEGYGAVRIRIESDFACWAWNRDPRRRAQTILAGDFCGDHIVEYRSQ